MSEAKLTRIHESTGAESKPEVVALVDGSITFPPSDGNSHWCIYLPPHGLESAGVFYRFKEVKESDLPANRRLSIDYVDSELIPELADGTDHDKALSMLEHNLVVAGHNLFCRRWLKTCDCDLFPHALDADVILDDILDAEEVG